ncbi:ATP binding protein [Penicillium alfredii]|uniref:ATP binding protein n=1 Tax=Penicillium alfredii TaxID=1506179 RepID=A0A9W9FQI4_9EURO|nr:ATP binding protein [Penicillium alfredii]KAJ5104558.1 ATP binding protein [Penicillium alfredii]
MNCKCLVVMSGSRSRRAQVNHAIQQFFRDPETPDTKEDWTLKPELPSADEILGDDPPSDEVHLAPNHISTPWPSVQTYLRTHYTLVREDSVAPLRDAVAHVRNVPQRKDTKDLSVYEKVYIVGATLATRGQAFTLRFSTRRAGKKIIWKPLDKVNRDPPEIDIFFANLEDICFDPQKEWIMVEARSEYYEAHRHTMTALQKLSTERPAGDRQDLRVGCCPQGPALSNMRPGDPPIIVAAQTNHALDQFLNHVAQFEPNYIRLGRRSTDVDIRQRRLFSVRNEQGRWVKGGVPLANKQQHQDLVNWIVGILDAFSGMEDKGPIESSSFLRSGLLTQEQCDSLQAEDKGWLGLKSGKYESPMSLWLGGRLRQFEADFSSPNFVEDEIDLEYEQLRQPEAQQGLDEDTWEGL